MTEGLPNDGQTQKSPGNLKGAGAFDFGAGDEVRTRDIQLGKLTLYQLSYTRRANRIVVHCPTASSAFIVSREVFALPGKPL